MSEGNAWFTDSGNGSDHSSSSKAVEDTIRRLNRNRREYDGDDDKPEDSCKE